MFLTSWTCTKKLCGTKGTIDENHCFALPAGSKFMYTIRIILLHRKNFKALHPELTAWPFERALWQSCVPVGSYESDMYLCSRPDNFQVLAGSALDTGIFLIWPLSLISPAPVTPHTAALSVQPVLRVICSDAIGRCQITLPESCATQ